MVPLLFQLPLQPDFVHTHSLQVFAQDGTVHNDFGGNRGGGRGQPHIRRIQGTFVADRQHGQPSVVFKHGGLDLPEIEISLLPAHHHKLAQIQLGFFQIIPVQLAVVQQDGGGAVDEFSCPGQLAGDHRQQIGCSAVDDHSRQRLPGLFQLGGQLGSHRADGDAGDVVEKIQLGHLLVSQHLGDQEQRDHRQQRGEYNLNKIHSAPPFFGVSIPAGRRD